MHKDVHTQNIAGNRPLICRCVFLFMLHLLPLWCSITRQISIGWKLFETSEIIKVNNTTNHTTQGPVLLTHFNLTCHIFNAFCITLWIASSEVFYSPLCKSLSLLGARVFFRSSSLTAAKLGDQNESPHNATPSENQGCFSADTKHFWIIEKDADSEPLEYPCGPPSLWCLWLSPLRCTMLRSPALKVQTYLTRK